MISFNNLGNYGRLGNQMFQYAALRGVAAHKNYEFCVPRVDLEINAAFKLHSCTVHNTTFNTIEESTHNFDKNFFDSCPDNIDLLGYFQTEKYFKHIEQDIRKDFTFHDDISTKCESTINNIRNIEMIDTGDVCSNEIIALHVRRGDYTDLQAYHTLLPLEYYEQALNKLPYVHVLVFSDDIEWCRQQPLFKQHINRFFFSVNNTTSIDMCLMSMCNYHIIANSSFSWWGAWLAKSKQVIAPSQWFGPTLSHKDTSDVYCEGWIKI